MKLKLILDIARVLLIARWKQTLIAAVGVTFGITMFITLLSFMNGLNGLLDGLILNRTAHVRLYNELKPTEQQPIMIVDSLKRKYHFIRSIKPSNARVEIYNVLPILQNLRNDKRIKGVVPKVSTQVFYNIGPIEMTGVINGINVTEENALFFFADYIVAGNGSDLETVANSIILGKNAAEQMQVDVGNTVQVSTIAGETFLLKVVGLFQSGLADVDKVQSYASIQTTQKLLGKPNSYITDLSIKLFDMSLAPKMAKEFEKLYGCNAIDIQTANAQFETGSSIRSLISYAVGITLLVVAGFGIFNILNMMIYEKMDSIAIMKATGFSGRDVKWIFIIIAVSIGIFGGLIGLFFGFVLTSIIDQIPFITEAMPSVTTYPIDYNIKYYLIAIVFSLITTYLSGYLPARKASKIDPVDIIRGK